MVSDNKTDILIAKFFSGEALPEEAMVLEDWANESPENRAYFNNYSKIVAMTIDITINHKNRIWDEINHAIYNEASKLKPKTILFNWRLAGIAALVVLVVTTTLLINNQLAKNNAVVYQAEAIAREVVLKDKSGITVLPNSSVTIDKAYGVSNRKIKLAGSATFSVIHNPSQAFTIDVNRFHIKDLGTKFTVVSSPASDTILIQVTEGEIAAYDDFGSSGNAVAGDKVVYIQSQKKLRIFPIQQAAAIIAAVSSADSAVPYAPYSSTYKPGKGHTEEGKQALQQSDSLRTARLIADLWKDKLITTKTPLSFKLSNTEFIVNGKLQGDAIFQRYKKKYVPESKGPGTWAWCYNFDEHSTIQ